MALLTFVYEKEATSKSYIGKGLLKSSVGDGSVDVSGKGSIATSIEDRQEITKDDSYSEGFDTKVVTDALTYVDRRQQEIDDNTFKCQFPPKEVRGMALLEFVGGIKDAIKGLGQEGD